MMLNTFRCNAAPLVSTTTTRRSLISKRFFRSSISLWDHQRTPSSTRRELSGTHHHSAITTAKRQQHSKSSLVVADGLASSVLKYTSGQQHGSKFSNNTLLPKQPLPELNATLARYMDSLRPVLYGGSDRNMLRHTEACIDRFVDPSRPDNGLVLQDILYQRAVSRDNWALEKNLDQYLMDTDSPLPIHANPAKVMKRLHFADENQYLSYVTLFMKAVHSFKTKIDTDTLEVDRCNAYEKGQPMCMEQYKNIFSSYRVPGTDRDVFRVYNDDLANQFVIIMSRGQLFKVDLVVDSTLVSNLELFHQLKEIRRVSANVSGPQTELGYLTSLPRREWASIRQTLLKNPSNQRYMDLIERSSFMICLDDQFGSLHTPNEDVKNGLQLLHGSGVEFNSRNRWFEKTLQFVVCENGVNGLNREHSPSEGPITVNLINHVYRELNKSAASSLFDSSEMHPFSEPERLEWALTDELVGHINDAKQRFDRAINNFDLTLFKYDKFGRTFPKLLNMSPDSFFQVAYQLAYFRMYGRLPVHVSFASQRRFLKGRADYIRAASDDVLNFCIAMNSPLSTMSERYYLLEKAVETQTRIMVDTILGNGFDCHMYTLKKLAKELYGKLPDVFKDPAFAFNSEYQLVTSQVTTSDDGTFSCFSPTAEMGYGSSYNLKSDHILFAVSSYKSCENNSIGCFSDSIVDSLDQVLGVCQHRLKSSHHETRRAK